nr:rasGAP-activating-like protein 1 [Pelodiscus sinensis]|eukprot:XP_025044452.1 rasGAP-activating-like protein 1 [Pelodiscus sinensis]
MDLALPSSLGMRVMNTTGQMHITPGRPAYYSLPGIVKLAAVLCPDTNALLNTSVPAYLVSLPRSGTSDPYCIVKVDNEVVARTATVWKNLNPFWGEEYTLHLPMGFHSLAFYVLDEDTIGHDDVIGKISLSREWISSHPRGIDNWINLTRVEPNEEVQGEICLELKVREAPQRRILHCHVIEARDLAPRDISGTSDPFVRVSYDGHTLETAIIKKTRFPHWDEVLEFDLEEGVPGKEPKGSLVSVEVWDWDMVGKNDFLGQIEFSLAALQRSPAKGWFRLLPFPTTEEDAGGKLGALRLKVRLAEDRILPSMYYQPLIELLVESILCPAEEDVSPLALLEEISSVESRQDVATKLVKIFLGQGLAVPFLDYLNLREVTKTTPAASTPTWSPGVHLFPAAGTSQPLWPRGCGWEWLGSRFAHIPLSCHVEMQHGPGLSCIMNPFMEQFMKVVGMPYLHEVLKPIVNRIFEEKKYVELDPCKIELNRTRRISFKGSLSEAQVRESSQELLKGYLSDIMESIIGSVEKCPPTMRVAFKQLHKRVAEQFPEAEHEDVKYIAISGFLFLRFFAPAILTPKLFNLRDQHADTRTSRTLLLLAKVPNRKEGWERGGTSSFVLFDSLPDPCMGFWNTPQIAPLLVEQPTKAKEAQVSWARFSAGATPHWFQWSYASLEIWPGCPWGHVVTSGEAQPRTLFHPSLTIKEGYLHKHKAEGLHLLPRFTFQKRYFWLSSEALSYLTRAGSQREARWGRGLSPSHPPCRPHWCSTWAGGRYGGHAAPSSWALGATRSAARPLYPEPAWQPPRALCESLFCLAPACGCSRTHSAVTLGDWSDPLDPDAEAQMVYGQLLLARDRLRSGQARGRAMVGRPWPLLQRGLV